MTVFSMFTKGLIPMFPMIYDSFLYVYQRVIPMFPMIYDSFFLCLPKGNPNVSNDLW